MDENEIRMSILRYVDANPRIQDTLDNIAVWWVMLDRFELRIKLVRKVASELVSEGLLIEKQTAGSSPLYGPNPERLSEIRALVEGGLDAQLKDQR